MKKKIIFGVAIILVAIFSLIEGFTLAKYFNFNSAEGNTTVAKWSVKSSFKTNGTESTDIKLLNTYDPTTLSENKIAPGTSGQFEIMVDATGTETALDYKIEFVDGENTVKPTNLKFSTTTGEENITKSTLQELEETIKGSINADEENKVVVIPINWIWEYETIDEDGTSENGDIQDTSDGENLSEYLFTVNITCTQVVPQSTSIIE